MALTERVDLTISLTVNSTCSTMTLADTTPDYGGSGKIATSNITSSIIVVNMPGGIYLTYTFTISANVITAATLGISGAIPVSILSKLNSTVFPFITNVNAFDLFGSYGVTLPEFGDGAYDVDYTVKGNVFEVLFNYTTSLDKLSFCDICLCIAEKGAGIDPDCNCEDDKVWDFLRADAYLSAAIFAAEIGNMERAQLCLDKATDICNCGCPEC